MSAQQVGCSLFFPVVARDNRLGFGGIVLRTEHGCARNLQSKHVPGLQTEPRHCPADTVSLGLAQSEVFPHLYSIPGKKKTEKWRLQSGPLWLLNSKRRLKGLRTGRRVAGLRKRKQQPGCLRNPVATGVCPGLRVKAQVTQSHLMAAALPGLGRCQLLVSISHPQACRHDLTWTYHICRLQRSLSKRSCKPRSLPSHRPKPSGCLLKVRVGTGTGCVVDRGRSGQGLVMNL